MNQKFRYPILIFIVVSICALSLSSGTYVFAQDNSAVTGSYASHSAPVQNLLLAPVAGGPGFYTVSPVDFTPEIWNRIRGFEGNMLLNPNQISTDYIAPVHLPHGAAITKMTMYYLDNANPNLDLQVWLLECGLATASCQPLIYGVTAHASPDIRIGECLPAGSPVVDLQSNYYLVEMNIPGSTDIRLSGIRIDYGYPVYLPTISR